MIVCLVFQGDSASPGARERMCSGFHCWRRSMPSTCTGGWWAGPCHLRLPPGACLCSPSLQNPVISRRLAAGPGVGRTGLEMGTLEAWPAVYLPFPALISQMGMREGVCFFPFSFLKPQQERCFYLFVFHPWGQAASLHIVREERGQLGISLFI